MQHHIFENKYKFQEKGRFDSMDKSQMTTAGPQVSPTQVMRQQTAPHNSNDKFSCEHFKTSLSAKN